MEKEMLYYVGIEVQGEDGVRTKILRKDFDTWRRQWEILDECSTFKEGALGRNSPGVKAQDLRFLICGKTGHISVFGRADAKL